METAFAAIQAGILMVTVSILIVVCLWCKNNRTRWLYAVGAIVWMIHSIVFYGLMTWWNFFSTSGPPIPSVLLTNWSVVLRAHGYITTLTIVIAIYQHGGTRGSGMAKGS